MSYLSLLVLLIPLVSYVSYRASLYMDRRLLGVVYAVVIAYLLSTAYLHIMQLVLIND